MSPQHSEYKSAKFIHSDTYIHTHTYRHSTAADLKSRKKFFFLRNIRHHHTMCVCVRMCIIFICGSKLTNSITHAHTHTHLEMINTQIYGHMNFWEIFIKNFWKNHYG